MTPRYVGVLAGLPGPSRTGRAWFLVGVAVGFTLTVAIWTLAA